ncbi:MAG TPA: hypothetical protein VGJ32_06790 [Solirubrobacteraceae bacterium]
MAAQAKSTKTTPSKNRSVVGAARDAGRQYLDTVEKTWKRVADFQEELGKASGTGLLVSLGRTQAGVTREVSGAYLRAARKIVG